LNAGTNQTRCQRFHCRESFHFSSDSNGWLFTIGLVSELVVYQGGIPALSYFGRKHHASLRQNKTVTSSVTTAKINAHDAKEEIAKARSLFC